MQKIFRVSLLSITFALLCVLAPAMAVASNYSVTPLVIDKELEKRDIVEEKIMLTNNDSRVIRIYPTVNEIAVSEGGSVQTFLEPSMIADRTSSITSWLEIGRGRIELQPGETKEMTLTIRVNPEVTAGEYHAFVGFPEGSNRPDAEKKVIGGNVPGTVIRIGVDKVQNQFLRLEKFTVERFIKGSSEGDISLTLQNPGDDAVVPKGEIIFYDMNGIEVRSIPINADSTAIEPKTNFSFSEEVPKDIAMGKYKAFLAVEYGEHQTASLNDTAFFYVLPLKLLIILFVTVLIFAILVALYVHRRYDTEIEDHHGASDVAMYVRQTRSESKDHDIDLSKKNVE